MAFLSLLACYLVSLLVLQSPKKAKEDRLRLFGHVKRRDYGYEGNEVLEMEIEGRRKRGQPKTQWMDRIKEDMNSLGLDEEVAMDRRHGKLVSSVTTPPTRDKLKEEKAGHERLRIVMQQINQASLSSTEALVLEM